ncbi:MAG TPA: isocitrate lyase/phosphoenolpyruvate mutase family protein [Thermomicrobiales bacterium]|nr:isocitrate lyase/phosphoenolpyruvate mutase family protein [Thermomicrobiales bacterium]
MSDAARVLDLDTQRRHAEAFAELHHHRLVLPNAWDAGSARIIARAGAKAIATTSGGCAWSSGVADGGGLDRDRATAAVRAIVRVVDIPVTADIETGYGTSLDELATTITGVLEAGAVGVNLEDSGRAPLYAPEEMAERIATARDAAGEFGVPLFINARTDVYLHAVGDPAGRLDDVIGRARVYADAGANGIFVPGLLDLEALRTLAAAVELPVNVMVGPGAPSIDELATTGARRFSAGTGITMAAYSLADRATRELLTQGTYTELEGGLNYGVINGEFSR